MKALTSWLCKPLTYSRNLYGNCLAGLLIIFNAVDVLLRVDLHHIPKFFHAWSQTDRLALVHGFLNNGFNLFLPQSYSLDHHLLISKTPGLTGITSVDMPLHEYIVSLIMYISNTTSPAVFYLYVVSLSCIGLFFLYRATFIWSKSQLIGLLVLILTISSPMYGYYMVGFLPAIPAIATALIGLYYLVMYNKTTSQRQLIVALVFFSLSALVRFPFIILLIGLLCVHLAKLLGLSRKSFGYKGTIAAILLVLSYFAYNQYLSKLFGSVFLAKPIPANSLEGLIDKINITYAQLFYVFHIWEFWWAISIATIASIWAYFKHRNLSPIPALTWFGLAISVGGLSYLVLMSGQFPEHDYYLLDSLFVPIIVMTVCCSRLLEPTNQFQAILIIPFLYIGVAKGVNHRDSVFNQRNQVQPWDRQIPYMKAFADSDVWLDSLNIPRDVHVLVPDANSPTIPLVQMKRSGFTNMNQEGVTFATSMKLPYDYIAVPTMAAGSRWLDCYPEATAHISLVSRKPGLLLYTYHPDTLIDKTVIGAMFGKDANRIKTVFDGELSFQEGAEFTEWYRDTATKPSSLEIICALPTAVCKEYPGWVLSCSVNGKRKSPYHYFYDIAHETDKVLRDTIHFGFTVHHYNPDDVLTIYFYHPNRSKALDIPAQLYILEDDK